MTLRFYAARDALVCERHEDGSSMQGAPGALARFVGRTFDPDLRGFAATKEGYSIDATPKNLGEVAYLIRETKDGDLYPADKATADACGVTMPDLEFTEGAWLPRAPAAFSAPSKFATKEAS